MRSLLYHSSETRKFWGPEGGTGQEGKGRKWFNVVSIFTTYLLVNRVSCFLPQLKDTYKGKCTKANSKET